jgi:hypothetical protein
MESSKDYLLLKWGTIKGYCLKNNEKTFELMKEYNSLGVSFSVMAQEDTPRQKELILEMIDSIKGTITNDWTGENMTKKQAKKYILEYGKKQKA